MNPEQIKEEIIQVLEDYKEVKQQAIELGYNDEAIKLRDYIDYYIRLNNK